VNGGNVFKAKDSKVLEMLNEEMKASNAFETV
jgi:hypothetical protein